MVHAAEVIAHTVAAPRRWYADGTSNVRWGAWAMPGMLPTPRRFLACDEAKYITGTELVVDCGLTVNWV